MLKQYLENPTTPIDVDWALSELDRHPYFSFVAALTLKHNGDSLTDEQRRELLARASLTAPDMSAFLAMTDPDEAERARFYPPEHTATTPSTDEAIATFLDNYGKPSPEEEALLERMIFNPVPDYAGVLEADDNSSAAADAAAATPNSQDALINTFIATHPPQSQPSAPVDAPANAPAKPEAPEAPAANVPIPEVKTPAAVDADAMLSESLAKIYIRQKRFAKAYEIISQLNLNFPEKSVYFADQLRFLQKMMLIERYSIKKS